jgi:hypothetical protein
MQGPQIVGLKVQSSLLFPFWIWRLTSPASQSLALRNMVGVKVSCSTFSLGLDDDVWSQGLLRHYLLGLGERSCVLKVSYIHLLPGLDGHGRPGQNPLLLARTLESKWFFLCSEVGLKS